MSRSSEMPTMTRFRLDGPAERPGSSRRSALRIPTPAWPPAAAIVGLSRLTSSMRVDDICGVVLDIEVTTGEVNGGPAHSRTRRCRGRDYGSDSKGRHRGCRLCLCQGV